MPTKEGFGFAGKSSSVPEGLVFEKDPLKIDETLNRVQQHQGVTAVLVANYDGSVVRSNIDSVQSVQIASQYISLAIMARNTVRDLDPENNIQVLRIKTKKNEVMISAAPQHFFIIIQNPSDK